MRLDLACQALESLPEDDLKTRAFVAAMLGTGLQIGGDLEVAAHAFCVPDATLRCQNGQTVV